MHHAAMTPIRMAAEATRSVFQHPMCPLAYTSYGRTVAATAELTHRMTRRFSKPEWELNTTKINGKSVPVDIETVVHKPFCNLIHFKRALGPRSKRNDPKLLLVAPVSGHYATLLRGTVEALIPDHEVYVTDWIDARQIPLTDGKFHLEDYITYVMEFLHHLGPDVHVMAVCQPAVPVLAAAALMAEDDDPDQPLSMTLMGGPIDTRAAPTAVTEFSEKRSLSWYRHNVVTTVPPYYPGAFRKVYPGFIQLTNFISMNIDRHVGAHFRLFEHLVTGDGDSAESHRGFYNEYLAVMDLPGEFYLDTVDQVFHKKSLPKGEMMWRGRRVDPAAIRKTALLTVEGEKDDISAVGQTSAAHGLCKNLPAKDKVKYVQQGTGHYGIFNGRRWREQIMPRVRDFIRSHDSKRDPVSTRPYETAIK